jgi:filamentous hemagglutinin family protein
MNKIISVLFILCSYSNLVSGQKIVNAYTKEGKVLVQFENGSTKQIVVEGFNTVVGFSQSNNVIFFKRLENKSKTKGQEGESSFDQFSMHLFNLNLNKESILFTTCLDGNGGTKPDYANSSIFPSNSLCGLESIMVSKDGNRIFFQTEGWATCPAIHYYNIKENKLIFFKAGWLQKLEEDGVVVQITGIETSNNQGKIESKGRFVQTCLFDMNGILLKELTKKEF